MSTLRVDNIAPFTSGSTAVTITALNAPSLNIPDGDLSITGSINFGDGSAIQSISQSSGDGNGYTTLVLKPDTALATDQYIVLDPTSPGHIHVRAGGEIDNSGAYLYLGGEDNNVKIDDGGRIDISAEFAIKLKVPSYQFETFYDYDWSGSAEWVDVGGGLGQIIFNTPTLALNNLINSFSDYLSVSASINSGDPIPLTSWGSGNPSNIYTISPPVSSPTLVTQIEFTLLFENRLRLDPDEGNLDFRVGDFNLILDSKRDVRLYAADDIELYAQDDLRLQGEDYIALRNTSTTAPIRIITDYNNSEYEWTFEADGKLRMPGSLEQGSGVLATGSYSHAEGSGTQAIGEYSHAEGRDTQATGEWSHAEGRATQAIGSYSHTEGASTQTIGEYSHAEGRETIASGSWSHAEGYSTQTQGVYSHAEGTNTQAIGEYSHAEGNSTEAIESYSHAEGEGTKTFGTGSHAEGDSTIAIGNFSHTEGYNTIAAGNYQHVQGQYNLTSSAQSAFIIGNGIDNSNRSNLVFASGSNFEVTGSISITNMLTLTPQHPLPSQPPTGSFAVSSSVPPRPFFWDGTNWNALY